MPLVREHVKGVFFISSFIPLYVIFIVLHFNFYPIDLFFSILTFLSLGLLWYVFSQLRDVDGEWKIFEEVENINKINLEYFVVYIIPFLSIDLFDYRTVISLLILFGIMCLMYVRSDSIYMNPMFTIIGLNIFRVKTHEGEEFILISRKRIDKHKSEEAKELTYGVLVGA